MRRNNDGRFLAAERTAEGVVLRFIQPFVVLDDSNAQRMSELVTHFIDGGEVGHLIVELDTVEYVCGLALGVFVRLHRQVMAQGGRLTLRNLSDPVYEVFEATQLTRILNICAGRPSERDGSRPCTTSTACLPAS
ncbi:MAG TPA: STAS domain-containing protein [Gemmataceae bacterium]|jgi:anti-anti-sigma factor